MKVELTELVNHVLSIKSLVSDNNKSMNLIMLNFQKDVLSLCYADGRSSYKGDIDVEAEEGDIECRVLVGIEALLTRLDMYKTTGDLMMDPLSIQLDIEMENLKMHCVKYMNFVVLDENDDPVDNGMGEALTERKNCNVVNTELHFTPLDKDGQFNQTTKMDYEAIFESDNWVTCGVGEFKGLLSRLRDTDGVKACYISPQRGSGFAVGTGYTTIIPLTFDALPCSLTPSTVKKVVDILARIGEDSINIAIEDSRFLKICTEGNTVGMVFEQAPVTRYDMLNVDTFENLGFDEHGLLYNKSALLDMLRGALLSGNVDEISTDLVTKVVDGKVGLGAVRRGSTGNATDNLEVYADSVSGGVEFYEAFKIRLSLRIMQLMTSSCVGNAVSLDFCEESDSSYMRVTDLQKSGSSRESLGYYYICLP